LEQLVAPLERTSGFVQRASKLGGVRFVQMVVLACLGRADVTLGEMVAVGEALGVRLSVPGLNQRINQAAVVLLQVLLAQALRLGGWVAEGHGALFARFCAVYLHDSSYLSLPKAMAAAWRGAGGSASTAGAKLWLSFEYRTGCLAQLGLGPGIEADQGSRLPQRLATPGSLHLFDLGFFSQYLLADLAAVGSFFVCRFQYQTALYTEEGGRIDLAQRLTQSDEAQLEFTACLGATRRLPVRLLCQRLPQAVADKRRRKAKAVARRRRRTLAPLTWQLMEWNLFCTNVPAEWWRLEQVLAVYRLRWQIELLFKLLKSQLGLEHFGAGRTERILVHLYARLLGLLLVTHLLAPVRLTAPRELSLPKAVRLLPQRLLPKLIAALAHPRRRLEPMLRTFADDCLRLALKDKRTKDPSTFDRLLALEV
jgi:hypothetical protein